VIDFRYHVVSIMAVFLALALGLFIGSTELTGTAASNINGQVKSVLSENKQLSTSLADARSQLSHQEAFDKALEPYAVAGRLAGQSVVVVSAPGVDSGLRSRVTAALTAAGATVNGDVRLQGVLLDPQQDSLLRTLSDRVTPASRTLPPAGSGNERALALLADVLGARPQVQSVSPGATARVLSAFTAGRLISVSGSPPRPATLALLVAAPAPSSTPDTAAAEQQSLLGEFAHDLDQAAVGAVVTGPAAASAAGGLLDVVRSDKALRAEVSTVDSADQPSGVIATVLALAEQADGRAGSYGSGSGADAPLPSPSPS
jgi:hypothetical protein